MNRQSGRRQRKGVAALALLGAAGALPAQPLAPSGWEWQDAGLIPPISYFAAAAPDANTRVVLGDRLILRSFDRGATWRTQRLAVSMLAVAFAGPSRGIAVGTQGSVLRTSDGGVTWKPANVG